MNETIEIGIDCHQSYKSGAMNTHQCHLFVDFRQHFWLRTLKQQTLKLQGRFLTLPHLYHKYYFPSPHQTQAPPTHMTSSGYFVLLFPLFSDFSDDSRAGCFLVGFLIMFLLNALQVLLNNIVIGVQDRLGFLRFL